MTNPDVYTNGPPRSRDELAVAPTLAQGHGAPPVMPATDHPATIAARVEADKVMNEPWYKRFLTTEFLTTVFCVLLVLADSNDLMVVDEELYAACIAYVLGRSLVKGAAAFRSGVKS